MINYKIFWLLGAIFTLGFLFSCGGGSNESPQIEVQVLQVREMPAVVYKEFVGNLEGANDTEIRAQVKGYVTKIAYQEGSRVKEGEILFEIDPREAKAALAKAQGDLTRAKSSLRQTEQDLARYKQLITSGAVSKKELDDAKEAVSTAQGQVNAQKALLDQAKLNLEFTTVTAPISGIAGRSKVNVGDLVGPNQGNAVLTTLSDLESVKLNVPISEQFYLKLVRVKTIEERQAERAKSGQGPAKLELILADGKIYPHPGMVVLIDRQIDQSTGTITVQAHFPNPRGILRPGLFARVRAPVEEIPDAIRIPQRSVQDLQGLKRVALVDKDNKILFKQIELGSEVGQFYIVKSGLTSGDRIVVEGLQKIQDGLIVKPLPVSEELIPKPMKIEHFSTEIPAEEKLPEEVAKPSELTKGEQTAAKSPLSNSSVTTQPATEKP